MYTIVCFEKTNDTSPRKNKPRLAKKRRPKEQDMGTQ